VSATASRLLGTLIECRAMSALEIPYLAGYVFQRDPSLRTFVSLSMKFGWKEMLWNEASRSERVITVI
jgi:hypothetical protein